MFKFYEIVFTNKIGVESVQIVIGTETQANDYAIKESSLYGFAYSVRYVASDKLDNIKNITNY